MATMVATSVRRLAMVGLVRPGIVLSYCTISSCFLQMVATNGQDAAVLREARADADRSHCHGSAGRTDLPSVQPNTIHGCAQNPPASLMTLLTRRALGADTMASTSAQQRCGGSLARALSRTLA